MLPPAINPLASLVPEITAFCKEPLYHFWIDAAAVIADQRPFE